MYVCGGWVGVCVYGIVCVWGYVFCWFVALQCGWCDMTVEGVVVEGVVVEMVCPAINMCPCAHHTPT